MDIVTRYLVYIYVCPSDEIWFTKNQSREGDISCCTRQNRWEWRVIQKSCHEYCRIEFISLHWCTSDKLSYSLVLRFQHIERRDHPLQLLWERWRIHAMVALHTHLLWTSNVIYTTGTTSLDTHFWICSKQQGDLTRDGELHSMLPPMHYQVLHQFQDGTRQPLGTYL